MTRPGTARRRSRALLLILMITAWWARCAQRPVP
jgi:hypothetical protein